MVGGVAVGARAQMPVYVRTCTCGAGVAGTEVGGESVAMPGDDILVSTARSMKKVSVIFPFVSSNS